MESDGESRRFCDVCTKNVHDISSMTETTARAVLADESAKGRVCVRYTLDAAGHIKFKVETVAAPSLWRMTLAAAGMAMALMTGCADAEPDRVMHDKCVYEVGPWGFTTARGEGTCPAVTPEPPEEMVVGMIEPIEPIEPPPEPIREVKGDVGPPEPVVEVLGEAPMVEPPPPRPEPVRMGKIAAPPEPVEIELMGDIAPVDEPCDPATKREGPLRL